ncbi:hypothetical protein Tco_1496195, partial [Tanacetum coccineum]
HVQNFNRGSTSSNRSNVNGRQWNENATPSTTIPLAGSTRLPPERKIQVRRHHIDNLIVVKELHPGTTTSRKSRRTTIRDIPHINFDEDGDDTTPIVFDKFSGISKDYFDHGDPTEECQECHALLWRAKSLRGNPNASKKSFSLCCNNRKVLISKAPDTPEPLLDLFLNDDNYHSIGSLLPEESKPPKFAQLYIFDTDNEVENRAAAVRSGSAGPSNKRHPIDTEIIGDVRDILEGCNKLVETFRMARDRCNENTKQSIKIKLITKKSQRWSYL